MPTPELHRGGLEEAVWRIVGFALR